MKPIKFVASSLFVSLFVFGFMLVLKTSVHQPVEVIVDTFHAWLASDNSVGTSTVNNSSLADIGTGKYDDGCGLVDNVNRNSSTWVDLSEDEINHFRGVQTCLRHLSATASAGTRPRPLNKYATGYGHRSLKCNMNVNMETIRSALSQYDTIWLHGDSIMMQQFYTLACMINSTVDVDMSSLLLAWPRKMDRQVGLWSGANPNYSGVERFTFLHPRGKTQVLYSRFGRKWGLDANLYKYDFPFSIRNLTSNDAILINAASHYDTAHASQMETAIKFIGKQSLSTNATVFYMEPTPEEWPTTNGMFGKAFMLWAKCEKLDDARLMGRGNLTQLSRVMGGINASRVKPDPSYFGQLHTDRSWEESANRSICTPDCIPATWRVSLTRSLLGKISHKIRLVPVFWQLVSKETESGRGIGDCTHRDLYATVLFRFQWVRTILDTKNGPTARRLRNHRMVSMLDVRDWELYEY